MTHSVRLLACILAFIACGSFLFAQNKGPAKSPLQTLTQVVGTTPITVKYSRPGMNDREIFGGLVPFDAVSRAGANASTKLELAGDALIGDLHVPAGTYALYTIPGKDTWTIIISKNSKLWGSFKYDSADDLGRFTAKATKLSDGVESFTIGFMAFDDYSATMHLDWDHTRVAFPIKTMASE